MILKHLLMLNENRGQDTDDGWHGPPPQTHSWCHPSVIDSYGCCCHVTTGCWLEMGLLCLWRSLIVMMIENSPSSRHDGLRKSPPPPPWYYTPSYLRCAAQEKKREFMINIFYLQQYGYKNNYFILAHWNYTTTQPDLSAGYKLRPFLTTI